MNRVTFQLSKIFQNLAILQTVNRDLEMSRIGTQFLRKYKVAFDLDTGNIDFEPYQNFTPSSDPGSIDVLLKKRNNKVVVFQIKRTSNAEKAGLLPADELLTVDGHKFGSISLYSLVERI